MRKITGKDMKNDWNQRAIRNAEHYIDTDQKQWTMPEFLDAGRKVVQQYFDPFLDDMNYPLGTGTMLEVGVGIGRLLWWTHVLFDQSIGIDVSQVMIDKAKDLFYNQLGKEDKIRLETNNGEDLSNIESKTINFCYSWTVLQHIPSLRLQLKYIEEMCRVLKSGGLLLLQLHADHQEFARLYPEWERRQRTGDVHGWVDAREDLENYDTWQCNPVSDLMVRKLLVNNGIVLFSEEGQHTGRWVIYGVKE